MPPLPVADDLGRAPFVLFVLEPAHQLMLASEARTLAEEIGPELGYAGVRIPQSGRLGVVYWQDYVDLVEAAVTSVG